MHPIECQSFSKLQEELCHLRYILIDEMSFIGPNLLTCIDAHLCEVFPSQCTTPFGGCSIILLGDFGQLPPVKDIPMYAGSSHGNALWKIFNTFVTLSTMFCQQGNSPSQISFCQLLLNLLNSTPTLEDWTLLMTRTTSSLSHEDNCAFEHSTHLYATNSSVSFHNKHMLKHLNMPFVHFFA